MSELHTALEEYLAVRRALGFQLREEERALHNFVLFVEQEGASFITVDLALRWAMQPKNVLPAWWTKRLSMVRLFARYRSAEDPRTEIPPQGLLPHRYHRKTPYIYNDEEISRLIETAKQLQPAVGLRPHTYSTLFGLLAVTGMRMRESIQLDREDVDLTNGVLTIHQTKFGKSRLVPIQPSTQRILRQYECQRNRICPNPQDPSFFVSDRGTRLTGCTVRHTFVKVSRRIGLRESELIGLTCQDISLSRGAHVRCKGKGRKERCTPLRKESVAALRVWVRERNGEPLNPLFPNARGGPLSRDGIEYLLAKHAAIARKKCPSLQKKRISPHVLRHSAAMDLLQHGVDRSVIALWLGHESVETTQMYIQANLKLKEQALAKTAPLDVRTGRYRPDNYILTFLKSL